MVKMKDVALRAEVSQATVSRVINGTSYVEPQTRQKVLDVIAELGYKGNSAAKSLSSRKSSIIIVILPDIVNPYFSEMLSVIEDEAYQSGFEIMFMNSQGNSHKEKKLVENSLKYNPAGVLISPLDGDVSYLKKFSEAGVPVVTISTLTESFSGVAIDHRVGGELLAKHFGSLGHIDIGYIGNKDEKFEGFKDGLKSLNIPLKNKNCIEFYNYSSGNLKELVFKTMEKHLKENGEFKFSAIFTGNDIVAMEVINFFREKGIKVPEDIAVAGFDNISFTSYLSITTVAQPVREIGFLAFERLINEMKLGVRECKHMKILPRLIPRDTTIKKIV
ncbi:LacI family DNA-binding transcriptional regulator [Cetobacterium sp.]|uniref:LacI family DNA-binding transcriptional regulator n=3 Tax=Cetobacterium sp. TaxID=2071632 RepID=UPI0025F86F7C|nr:LacI family DNA-binding transcriptional regulator [uncultured Cetobacterium sp.]